MTVELEAKALCEDTVNRIHQEITSVLADTTPKGYNTDAYIEDVNKIKQIGIQLFTDNIMQRKVLDFLKFVHSAMQEYLKF